MSITATIAATAIMLAFATNQSGGEITLWAQRGSCPEGQAVAINTGPGGRAQPGCWVERSNRVIVQWDDGNLSMYRSVDFTMTPEAEELLAEPTPAPAPRPVVPRDPSTERSL